MLKPHSQTLKKTLAFLRQLLLLIALPLSLSACQSLLSPTLTTGLAPSVQPGAQPKVCAVWKSQNPLPSLSYARDKLLPESVDNYQDTDETVAGIRADNEAKKRDNDAKARNNAARAAYCKVTS